MNDNNNFDSAKQNNPDLDENGLVKLKHKGENSNHFDNTNNTTTSNDNITSNIDLLQDQGDSIDTINDTNLYQKTKQELKGQGDDKDLDFNHNISEKDKK